MGAALSLFVLLSLSVFVIRIATVALRLTGLHESSARFQALSAFSGTGFTTSEAEAIVNYPVRRKIVSLLMIIGNMGLVTVFATLVASLVHTDGEVNAILLQLVWLVCGLILLWFLILNKTADRIMCSLIGTFLKSTTLLGKQNYQRQLQVGNKHSVCEHQVPIDWFDKNGNVISSKLPELDLTLLAIRSQGKILVNEDACQNNIKVGDSLILFGRESRHIGLSWSND